MAKVTAPLLSFAASGAIGKSIVFGSWKGISLARKYVVPANPNTVAQQGQRNAFKWVHDMFKYLDSAVSSAWNAYAKGQKFTGMNAFTSKNLQATIGDTDLNDVIFVPSVLGGPPNAGGTVTPGANKLTVLGVPPTVPTGWTVLLMIATAMKQQIPSGEMEPNVSFTETKDTAPWTVDITGLTTGQAYVVGIGWKYQRADGKIAYGGSTNSTGTPT